MNMPPKKSISVARNVHMPSVAADFCCGMSSNCSAIALAALGKASDSGMLQFLLSFRGILVRRAGHDGNFVKIMLGRRRRRLPLQASGIPRVCRRFLAVFQ